MIDVIAIAVLFAQAPTSPAPAPQSAPALQSPPAPQATPAVEPSKPPVEPWPGSLADGLAEMRHLTETGKPDEALALSERLLEPDAFSRWRERATSAPGWKRRVVEAADPVFAAVGLSDLSGSERATVFLARGVVLAGAEKRGEAVEAFEKARALAGAGSLRLDATYDLGWTALAEGEVLRAKIPEIAGVPGSPQASGQPQPAPQATQPGTPPGLPGQPSAEPDPLPLARAAYVAARERFVERLKADWKDADTRANVELVQKRLRELAEIEKKREEEKKKQEEQQKEQQKKDGEQNQDEQKQKPDEKDQKKQDEQKKDGQEGDEKKDEPKPDEKPEEQKPPEEEKPGDQKDGEKNPQPQPASEETLTKEEVMRLLDVLKGREQEGQKLLEQLRRARRAPVKRDW